MGGKKIDFNGKKINKKDFYKKKKEKIFKIKDIDINKTLISEAESYGQKKAKKYIIGYSDDIMRPLIIRLPQMIGYLHSFDDKSTMLFLDNEEELLEKYVRLWKKIEDLIGKKFDSKVIYASDNGDKYIKTKIKSYLNNIETNFHDEKDNRKPPEKSWSYKCFGLIALDFVSETGKKYYPQTFLEECKHKPTKKKIEDRIVDDFGSSSESDGESDGESGNE